MKTSNKILLGLLVIIFTVPFLLATSLKTKMQKGEYTVKKWQGQWKEENVRSGSFTSFEAVKIVAPAPHLLTCRLTQSNDMSYKYYNSNGKDSVTVFTNNDTLYVQYLSEKKIKDEDGMEDYNTLSVELRLPAFNNITVDGAVVVMSMGADSVQNLSVTLRNKGVIKDDSKTNKEKQSGDVSMKSNKNVHPADNYRAEIMTSSNRSKIDAFKEMKVELPELPELHLREALLYRVFSRI